jgi:hypothetical protein
MRRIGLAVVLVLSLAVALLSGEAQPTAYRIGVLAQDLQPGLLEIFRDELQRLGYTEGRNITIEDGTPQGGATGFPRSLRNFCGSKLGRLWQ